MDIEMPSRGTGWAGWSTGDRRTDILLVLVVSLDLVLHPIAYVAQLMAGWAPTPSFLLNSLEAWSSLSGLVDWFRQLIPIFAQLTGLPIAIIALVTILRGIPLAAGVGAMIGLRLVAGASIIITMFVEVISPGMSRAYTWANMTINMVVWLLTATFLVAVAWVVMSHARRLALPPRHLGARLTWITVAMMGLVGIFGSGLFGLLAFILFEQPGNFEFLGPQLAGGCVTSAWGVGVSLCALFLIRNRRVHMVPLRIVAIGEGVRTLLMVAVALIGLALSPEMWAVAVVRIVYASGQLLLTAALVWYWWDAIWSKRYVPLFPNETVCQSCGYSLIGNTSGRCPECGQATGLIANSD